MTPEQQNQLLQELEGGLNRQQSELDDLAKRWKEAFDDRWISLEDMKKFMARANELDQRNQAQQKSILILRKEPLQPEQARRLDLLDGQWKAQRQQLDNLNAQMSGKNAELRQMDQYMRQRQMNQLNRPNQLNQPNQPYPMNRLYRMNQKEESLCKAMKKTLRFMKKSVAKGPDPSLELTLLLQYNHLRNELVQEMDEELERVKAQQPDLLGMYMQAQGDILQRQSGKVQELTAMLQNRDNAKKKYDSTRYALIHLDYFTNNSSMVRRNAARFVFPLNYNYYVSVHKAKIDQDDVKAMWLDNEMKWLSADIEIKPLNKQNNIEIKPLNKQNNIQFNNPSDEKGDPYKEDRKELQEYKLNATSDRERMKAKAALEELPPEDDKKQVQTYKKEELDYDSMMTGRQQNPFNNPFGNPFGNPQFNNPYYNQLNNQIEPLEIQIEPLKKQSSNQNEPSDKLKFNLNAKPYIRKGPTP